MAKENGNVWRNVTLVVAVLVALGSLAVVAYSVHTLWHTQSVLAADLAAPHVAWQNGFTAINVTSTANVSVFPNVGYLSFSITTNSSMANVSQKANAQVSAKVRSVLYSMGLTNSSITTTSYYLQPVYSSICRPPVVQPLSSGSASSNSSSMVYPACQWESVITGYQTVQSLQVNVSSVNSTGTVADAVVAAGGNNVSVGSIWFGLSPSSSQLAQQQALLKAAKGAYVKALLIANATGEQVSSLKSISEQSQQYSIMPYYSYFSAAKSVPTQITPGRITVSEAVTAQYIAD